MDEVARRFTTASTAPLVLDSTEPDVLEAGLQWLGGRAILNSANLEDGEAPGSRMDKAFTLAREYGAAVDLPAHRRGRPCADVEWSCVSPHRLHDIATQRYGLRAGRPHLRRPDVPALHR
ncbi:MAG: dihydropteroate synthase [Acidimicrobiales bacterium]